MCAAFMGISIDLVHRKQHNKASVQIECNCCNSLCGNPDKRGSDGGAEGRSAIGRFWSPEEMFGGC